MELKRAGSQPSQKGPANYFTGNVRIDPLHTAKPIVEFRAGDVIWCPPNHKHWHGATPTTSMTHIAIQEALDGKVVEWMEHVTDEQYLAGTRRS
jgi:mannose-6-phosphate isomerase-like protein (cupin superfamily)